MHTPWRREGLNREVQTVNLTNSNVSVHDVHFMVYAPLKFTNGCTHFRGDGEHLFRENQTCTKSRSPFCVAFAPFSPRGIGPFPVLENSPFPPPSVESLIRANRPKPAIRNFLNGPRCDSQKKRGSVREPWNDSRESSDSHESANRLARIGQCLSFNGDGEW